MNDNEIRLKIAKLKGYTFWDSPDKLGPWAFSANTNYAYYAGGIPLYKVDDPKPESVTWSDDAPNWPADIAAAWTLVDELNASGDGLVSLIYRTGDDLDNFNVFHWSVEMRLLSSAAIRTQRDYITAYADTAARAIALAWLKWRGVEVD